MVPHPTILTGQVVRLEPLEKHHIAPLMSIALASPEEYRFTSTPVNEQQQELYFAQAFSERQEGRTYPFVVLDATSGEILGSTRFADFRRQHRNCEIGYTWFTPRVFGSAVNVECKYLMLRYAFEDLALLRVQIHTDTRNTRSQRAIRALGARYEGVLRRHMITKDGFVRDTMVFAVTDLDWPAVEARLRERLLERGLSIP